MNVRALAIALVVVAAGGCDGSLGGGGDPNADSADVNTLAPRTITTAADFDTMAVGEGGTLIQGKSVKFLIDNRKRTAPAIYFVNHSFPVDDPQTTKYHYFFAQAVLPNFRDGLSKFNQNTYNTQDKDYFAGTIQVYKIGVDEQLLYGIQFYPQDVAKEQTILTAVTLVKKAFKIPGAKVAFVASGPQQTTATIGGQLAQLDVENTAVDKILGSLNYLAMNTGEAWGVLRIFPTATLLPTDIPVFDELPLDLSVVAGVMTRDFQDASAHVNLKSKERGTPDMVLHDASPDHPIIGQYNNQPVHLVVTANGFTIEPSTQDEVDAKFEEKLGNVWHDLPYVDDDRLLSFDDMCAGDPTQCLAAAQAYGSKAANLGFLAQPEVLGRSDQPRTLSASAGYNISPMGFGIPHHYYKAFLDKNPTIAEKVQELDEYEKTSHDPASAKAVERIRRLTELQGLVYAAQLPDGLEAAVRAKLAEVLPGSKKFKFRSSANAEDLANFDGAGLYDSYSANIDTADAATCTRVDTSDGVATKSEMKPKSVACVIKGVYASLWNLRAIEERNFGRIAHGSVSMGIAVLSKYDEDFDVVANSVVTTRVIGAGEMYGYTLSIQQGNNLVTNPDPGTISESTYAAFSDPGLDPTYITTRYATPVKGGPALTTNVVTAEQMAFLERVAQTAEEAYCGFKPGYYTMGCENVAYDPDKPKSLDMEFKLLSNGQFICKQMREFGGR